MADICIFMGDLNYRMNTTFSDFNNTNIHTALERFPTQDQLIHSMKVDQNYPGYNEAPINFLPSYKMSKKELQYVDKKN